MLQHYDAPSSKKIPMNYWLMINGQRLGPLTIDEIKNIDIRPETPVWHDGLSDWIEVRNVPELMAVATARQQQYQQPYQQTYQQPVYPQHYQQQPCQMPYVQNGNQPPYMAPDQGKCPNNYLVWAILATILCCVPFGIVAIVYSSKVQNDWNMGQYDKARSDSNKAQIWIIASVVCGFIFSAIYGAAMLFAGF